MTNDFLADVLDKSIDMAKQRKGIDQSKTLEVDAQDAKYVLGEYSILILCNNILFINKKNSGKSVLHIVVRSLVLKENMLMNQIQIILIE